MGEQTAISWTDHTFNPWMGCQRVAPGCQNCYAEAYAKRYRKAEWGPQGTRVKTSESYWRQPLKWNRQAERDGVRRRVFCASLADVFEEWQGPIQRYDGGRLGTFYGNEFVGGQSSYHPTTMDDVRRDLFALIDQTPHLDWLLLTKRPENVRRMWPAKAFDHYGWNGTLAGYWHLQERKNYRHNVWLGTSISDQATADRNVPLLLECRELCPVLFLSCEPLLGPVRLSHLPHPRWTAGSTMNALTGEFMQCMYDGSAGCGRSAKDVIDWVIAGGESGPNHRPMDLDWARSLRDQCRAADVPFFFKQSSGPRSGQGVELDGEIVQQFPEVAR